MEDVFPQAVHQQAGFLPDIYAPATAVQARPGDSLVALTLPVGTRTLVLRGAPAGAKVFVFGLEHAAVRAVDYEALSMLNISATRVLTRKV